MIKKISSLDFGDNGTKSYLILAPYNISNAMKIISLHFSLFFRPWAKKVVLAHDSYTCRTFYKTTPFPTKRKNGIGNFVGSVIALGDTIPFSSKYECPWKCRPYQHKNWTFC